MTSIKCCVVYIVKNVSVFSYKKLILNSFETKKKVSLQKFAKGFYKVQ